MAVATGTVKKAFAFGVDGRGGSGPAIEFVHPECPEAFWLVISDDDGVIVTVDSDFNVEWHGSKERAHAVLSERIE